MKALVTGDFGREYLAELADRTQLVCVRKGKKQDVVSYSTHDAGGITLNDFICAAKLDALFLIL